MKERNAPDMTYRELSKGLYHSNNPTKSSKGIMVKTQSSPRVLFNTMNICKEITQPSRLATQINGGELLKSEEIMLDVVLSA
jgi:hypothetical protein